MLKYHARELIHLPVYFQSALIFFKMTKNAWYPQLLLGTVDVWHNSLTHKNIKFIFSHPRRCGLGGCSVPDYLSYPYSWQSRTNLFPISLHPNRDWFLHRSSGVILQRDYCQLYHLICIIVHPLWIDFIHCNHAFLHYRFFHVPMPYLYIVTNNCQFSSHKDSCILSNYVLSMN